MPLSAVRTVSEDDNTHTIEGLLAYGGPFNGKDTYNTFFSARTDYALGLHPAGIPVLFNHGFDPDFGMETIGHTVPPASFRMDDDGMWVQMQLDKRQKYYATRVRPLLDKNGLGLSQGSAEHSIRFDDKSGEVLAWPMHEISLSPTEANPWNMVAARSADIIRIVHQLDPEAPNVVTVELDGKAIAAVDKQIALRADPDLDEDHPTTDAGITATATALRNALDAFLNEDPAVRAGRRNSTADQTHVDAIHAHATALGAAAHSSDTPSDDDADDAARTAEPVPTVRIVEPEDALPRLDLDAIAARVAQEAVTRLTG